MSTWYLKRTSDNCSGLLAVPVSLAVELRFGALHDWAVVMKPISISRPLDTALDSSHSYVTWMPHTSSRPLALILHFHARNWDVCGADPFVLRGLLSFAVMPWDSLCCVHPQLHSEGKSERRAVISYGKLFCRIHEMTLTPRRGQRLPCHLLSSSACSLRVSCESRCCGFAG